MWDSFKSTFNINTDTSDVVVKKITQEPYTSLAKSHKFGEKTCLLYKLQTTIFHVDINFRILSFYYENHAEVLKLEITTTNRRLETEITPCRNFLQRKRNLNLAFEILIKCVKIYEIRRLIINLLFDKQHRIKTTWDEFGGFDFKFTTCNGRDDTFMDLHWTIGWNVSELDIYDLLEFNCNYSAIGDKNQDVKQKLGVILHIPFDFQVKLRVWKLLLKDLYPNRQVLPNNRRNKGTVIGSVVEISDSDDNDVIEID